MRLFDDNYMEALGHDEAQARIEWNNEYPLASTSVG